MASSLAWWFCCVTFSATSRPSISRSTSTTLRRFVPLLAASVTRAFGARHRQSVDVAKEEPPLQLQAGRDTSSPPTGSPPVGGGAAAAAVNSSLDTPYCITESQILCLMLHKIGSAATLELLATVPEFADGLPPDAYVPIIKVGLQTQKRERYSLARSFIHGSVYQEQRLTHSIGFGVRLASIYPRLLDGINLYLWSQRATPLPQQLASIKDNEIAQAMQQLQPRAPSSVGSRSGSGGLLSSASLSGATSAASSGSLPTKVAPLPQAVLDRLTNNATPMPRFFEEPNASWGIETRLLQGTPVFSRRPERERERESTRVCDQLLTNCRVSLA